MTINRRNERARQHKRFATAVPAEAAIQPSATLGRGKKERDDRDEQQNKANVHGPPTDTPLIFVHFRAPSFLVHIHIHQAPENTAM